MKGLLADVNVQGHLRYLHQLLKRLDLWTVLAELEIELATFSDLDLPRSLDDRSLWKYCQENGWVLFTENRNHDGPDSLQATLTDSWHSGNLPILTLANKGRFERNAEYAELVVEDVAELVFGVAHGQYLNQSRIFVPR